MVITRKFLVSIIPTLLLQLIINSVAQQSPQVETETQSPAEAGNSGYSYPLTDSCINVPPQLLVEIQKFRPTVKKIGEYIINGPYKGVAYENLTDFVDTFGARLTGTESLERAIDEVLKIMVNNGLKNVHSESVSAPKWVRGFESLALVLPYPKEMQVFGLLPSIDTPKEGLTGEIVVIKSFDELYGNVDNIQKRTKGKILVLNPPYVDPVTSIKFRHRGAIEGSKFGAVAVLVRSLTPLSLNTPHTGEVHYESDVAPIPAAEITTEDADLLCRLHKKGHKIVLNLTLQNERAGNITTRNSIGDYVGASLPKEYVLVSGHIDSWDVGQGAIDDGYGVILSLMVPEVLRNMKFSPKRTIRNILWTASESGEFPVGAQQYVSKHYDEFQKYTMFLEADSGIFDVKGLLFNGVPEAVCIVSEILKLMEPNIIDKTRMSSFPDIKSDISELMRATGLPGAMLDTDVNKYYWYQHSNADTASALNSKDLDVCLAVITSLSYVLADLSVLLPKSTLTTGDIRAKKGKGGGGSPLRVDLGPRNVPKNSKLLSGKR